MDTQPSVTRQKTIAFWLIVGGMIAAIAGESVVRGLGLLAFMVGFGMFIAARLKQ